MDILDAEEQETAMPWPIYAIRLLLLTGCRLSEILTLTWAEVDLENLCFRLSDSKTGQKIVYISTAAAEVLKGLPQTSNPHVIDGRKEGAHLVNLHQPWHRIRKGAGLSGVRLHDLRHTFASIAVSNGLSLPVIGALLGHKHPQTTARYAHLLSEPLLAATEKISGHLLGRSKQRH